MFSATSQYYLLKLLSPNWKEWRYIYLSCYACIRKRFVPAGEMSTSRSDVEHIRALNLLCINWVITPAASGGCCVVTSLASVEWWCFQIGWEGDCRCKRGRCNNQNSEGCLHVDYWKEFIPEHELVSCLEDERSVCLRNCLKFNEKVNHSLFIQFSPNDKTRAWICSTITVLHYYCSSLQFSRTSPQQEEDASASWFESG